MLTKKDISDCMREMQLILIDHRKELDAIKQTQKRIQEYLNSSEVLAALARGVQRQEATNGSKQRDGAA